MSSLERRLDKLEARPDGRHAPFVIIDFDGSAYADGRPIDDLEAFDRKWAQAWAQDTADGRELCGIDFRMPAEEAVP